MITDVNYSTQTTGLLQAIKLDMCVCVYVCMYMPVFFTPEMNAGCSSFLVVLTSMGLSHFTYPLNTAYIAPPPAAMATHSLSERTGVLEMRSAASL